MAKKKAKVLKNSAYQVLDGWYDGKPKITKRGGTPVKKWLKGAKNFYVDDVVITSSAKTPRHYYWVWGTTKPSLYVKMEDVKVG